MKTQFNSIAVRNEGTAMQAEQTTSVKSSKKIETGYLYLIAFLGAAITAVAVLNSMGLIKEF